LSTNYGDKIVKTRILLIVACFLVIIASIVSANLQSDGYEYAPSGSVWSINGTPQFNDFTQPGRFVYCSQRMDGWNIRCRINIFNDCYSVTEGGTLLTIFPLGGVIPPGDNKDDALVPIQP
jgi:hypothetical protein